MMDLLLATSGGESQSASGGYVDDVFSAYTYTGNGSTQTINNGIDLAGKGGMVWTKSRSNPVSHALVDTVRGISSKLSSDLTILAQSMSDGVNSVTASGYTLGVDSTQALVNQNNQPYISWTFRKSPKFFDVVTYTGNGASNRALSHQLNADVGMVMIKATSTTGDWWVFHRSATGDLVLNTNAAQTASKANIPSATSSTFTVNGSANTDGVQYVAYLFAHDPSVEGIIQCGGYVGNGGAQSVNLGWEPQFLLVKNTSGASGIQDWVMLDQSRGINTGSADSMLRANVSPAENIGNDLVDLTATGFYLPNANVNQNPLSYIYLAIRRPNKPPTTGTQVYNAIARTGTGAAATVTGVGFAPDLVISKARYRGDVNAVYDRLRGVSVNLQTMTTVSEVSDATEILSFDPHGVTLGNNSSTNYRTNKSGWDYINHFFRRAPGFMDVVCYTGTGSATTVAHNLGAEPELMIVKCRNNSFNWPVYHRDIGNGNYIALNLTEPTLAGPSFWNSATPSASTFTLGGSNGANQGGFNYVAYLFASLPGISKVGSYTGNGTSQTINCVFATGARFILIKRTDSTGDWYVWDSVRGIIAANDPHLSLNTTAAEVTTDDSVDPEASGFIVNQNTTTNINVNGGQYIFLAIA